MRPSPAPKPDGEGETLGDAACAVGDAMLKIALPGALPLLALLAAALIMFKSPSLLLLGYAWMGIVSAGSYWLDKRRAQKQARRISEARLLALDFMGGWIGGLIAQRALRHKTSKRTYKAKFWGLVAVHLGCLALIILRSL